MKVVLWEMKTKTVEYQRFPAVVQFRYKIRKPEDIEKPSKKNNSFHLGNENNKENAILAVPNLVVHNHYAQGAHLQSRFLYQNRTQSAFYRYFLPVYNVEHDRIDVINHEM